MLFQDDVVDVEPAGEAGLHVVLENDVAKCLYRDELFKSLLDAAHQLRADIDQSDLIRLPDGDGKVGNRLLDRVAVVGEVKIRLQVAHLENDLFGTTFVWNSFPTGDCDRKKLFSFHTTFMTSTKR